MKKIIIGVGIICFLNGCSSITSVKEQAAVATTISGIKVGFDNIQYRDNRELQKYREAAKLMEKALNSEAFFEAILIGPETQNFININNPEPETKACEGNERSTFTFNVVNGVCMTNQDIVDMVKNGDWNLNVKIHYRPWALWCGWPFVNEIGRRMGDTLRTVDCHFYNMTKEALAAHLIHEQLHVLGFDHPQKDSVNRPLTVPYFVGVILHPNGATHLRPNGAT